MTRREVELEVLVDGEPAFLIDAPVMIGEGRSLEAATASACRLSFWAVVAKYGYEPEQVLVRPYDEEAS